MGNNLVEMVDSSGRVSRGNTKLFLSSFVDRLRRDYATMYRGKMGKYEIWIYTHYLKGEIEVQCLIISESEEPKLVYSHTPKEGVGTLLDFRNKKTETETLPPDIALNRILMSYLH